MAPSVPARLQETRRLPFGYFCWLRVISKREVSVYVTVLTQQYDFTEQDSGRTVTYTVTSRFEITLNQQKYPKGNLRVSCSRAGTLGAISNLPSETPPLYAVRYEGVQAGRCTIQNGTFLLTVKIIA